MKHKISIGLLVLSLILVWTQVTDPAQRIMAMLVLLSAWMAVTACGVYFIRANWFLRSLNRLDDASVALTFDDGPDPENTVKILSILSAHQVKATFFLIGEKAAKHPGLVRKILDEGHQIGNHSYTHTPRLGFFSTPRLKADFERCSAVLENISGQPVRLFRPPFGVTNPRYGRALSALELVSVGWTLRSYDTAIRDPRRLEKRIVGRLKPGHILLLHDTMPQTAEVLPALLQHLKEKQIACVKIEPYI